MTMPQLSEAETEIVNRRLQEAGEAAGNEIARRRHEAYLIDLRAVANELRRKGFIGSLRRDIPEIAAIRKKHGLE